MKLRFTKMQGAGNDFVAFDATEAPLELSAAQLRAIADRHFGVGADQILMVEGASRPGIDFRYRIFNGASGEEVEHCGNGARCFVRFVRDRGLTTKRSLSVETLNNVLELHLLDDDRVRVDMNIPVFEPAQVPFDAPGLVPREVDGFALWPVDLEGGPQLELAVLSMGNPHAVLVVGDVDTAPVATLGPQVEAHGRFSHRVNVGFLQVLDRSHVRLRVWERGAGETLCCGTGACAAVVAGVRLGLLDAGIGVDVDTRGGRLTIGWPGGDGHVSMIGPAETVFEGSLSI